MEERYAGVEDVHEVLKDIISFDELMERLERMAKLGYINVNRDDGGKISHVILSEVGNIILDENREGRL